MRLASNYHLMQYPQNIGTLYAIENRVTGKRFCRTNDLDKVLRVLDLLDGRR